MSTKVLVGRTILFVTYSMFGAWLFSYVERTPITYSEMSAKMLDELQRKYNIAMNHSEFIEFAIGAHEAFKVGKKVDWTFLNATSFVFSTLTTIGFGHMTPETTLGQLLTVLYSLVGLPITMLTLKTIGEVIVSGVRSLVLWIEKRLFKKTRIHRIKTKTFLGTCLLMIIFLLLGTVIEMLAEGWTFVEGIYAWFVTFSTIGFGDYVPLQAMEQQDAKYKKNAVLWVLIFGLAFFILAGFCVVSAVLTSLVHALEESKTTTITGVRKKRNNVLRATVIYDVERAGECEKQRGEFVLTKKFRKRSGTF